MARRISSGTTPKSSPTTRQAARVLSSGDAGHDVEHPKEMEVEQ